MKKDQWHITDEQIQILEGVIEGLVRAAIILACVKYLIS